MKIDKLLGRIQLSFEVISLGNDLCILLTGGQVPHLGAIAVAQVRPSLKDSSLLGASTSIITLVGHKEDAIAKYLADTLAIKLNKNVVACCGIHVENITTAELNSLENAVREFCVNFSGG